MEISHTETKTGKIFFVMVLSTMLLLSGFSAAEFILEKNRLRKEFAESIRDVPQRLAVSLETSLWILDTDLAHRIIDLEMENRKIHAVVIREPNSMTVFAARKRDENNNIVNAEGNISGKHLLQKKEIIRKEQIILGYADIWFSAEAAEESLRSLRRYMGIRTILTSVLLPGMLLGIMKLMQPGQAGAD